MASQKVYGVSETQVAKAPAYFDAVKGRWLLSYAAWAGARILDPAAERPVIAGLHNGLYILDYVRSEGNKTSTVDEVCIFVYNSPLIEDPLARRFAPGKEYSMPQPQSEWPPRKPGEFCNVMGMPPTPDAPPVSTPAPDINQTGGSAAPVIGSTWSPLTVSLVDPDPAVEITVTIVVPAEYSTPSGQTIVLHFPAHSSAPQGTEMLTAVSAGAGTFTYTVSGAGLTNTTGSFSYPVGGGAQ